MDTNFEIIEKYIDGDLEGKELLDFKELLSTDNDIKRDYNLSMEINNSIIEDDVMALRETMDYMYQEEFKVKRIPQVFTKRRFYYAAASAALLIATGGLVQRLISPNLDNNAVFEKYYAPYDVTVTYRSGNIEVDRLLLNALERYEEKDYEQALILFEEVLKTRENDMAISLYSGISYMEEEKYQKATKSFNNIITDNDNLFIEQAEWYLAMCYLKTEKTDKAQNVLNEIIKEESYYKDQATKVLKDIKN
ncbi:MAG: tetratricopeptide repeat protein [Bacteroidales bacterium]|nr:tetratricopeptide repeat protein [Bacteroidales bacterium]